MLHFKSNEINKAFEKIEPGEAAERKMLNEILTQKEQKQRRRVPAIGRLVPAMVAFMVVIGGTTAAGIALSSQDNFTVITPSEDFLDIYSGSGRYVGSVPSRPDGDELYTVSFSPDDVKRIELDLIKTGDIAVIKGADVENIEVSFYGKDNYYMTEPAPDYRVITLARNGYGDMTPSVVYLTLPNGFCPTWFNVKTTGHVLAENIDVNEFSITTPYADAWNQSREYFTVTIEDSEFVSAKIDADADVFVKGSRFTRSNDFWSLGIQNLAFYYNNNWAKNKRLLDFEDCEMMSFNTGSKNLAINLKSCFVGFYSGGNTRRNITLTANDSVFNTVRIHDVNDVSQFYNCKFNGEFKGENSEGEEFTVHPSFSVGAERNDFATQRAFDELAITIGENGVSMGNFAMTNSEFDRVHISVYEDWQTPILSIDVTPSGAMLYSNGDTAELNPGRYAVGQLTIYN